MILEKIFNLEFFLKIGYKIEPLQLTMFHMARDAHITMDKISPLLENFELLYFYLKMITVT